MTLGFLFNFLFFAILHICKGDDPLAGITEMNDKNYVSLLKDNEVVIAYFYAKNLKKCDEMNAEIARLKMFLESTNQSAKLVKVDVTKEDSVAVDFGVETVPKLKFVRYRFKIKNDYEGKPTFEEIKEFIIKKLSRKITEISSLDHAQDAETKNLMTVFICGDKESHSDKFMIIEKKTLYYDLVNITWTKDPQVRAYLNCTKDFEVVLMKNIDERYTRFEKEFTEYHYEEWISSETTPLVMQLSQEKLQIIFQENIPSLVFFSQNNQSSNYSLFYSNARLFKSDIFFFNTFNTPESLNDKLRDHFDISSPYDIILGFNFNDNELFKYKYEDFTKNLTEFIKGFLDGALNAFYKSEPVPEPEISKGFLKLVGINFLEKIITSNEDIVLLLKGKHCMICGKLKQRYSRLINHFKPGSGVIFASIDTSRNEVRGYDFGENFPRVLLISGQGQSRLSNAKSFPGNKYNLTELLQFISENAKHKVDTNIKFTREEETDPDDEPVQNITQEVEDEEEVIDLSHRYDNQTVTQPQAKDNK